jgi:hypothetical protein
MNAKCGGTLKDSPNFALTLADLPPEGDGLSRTFVDQ